MDGESNSRIKISQKVDQAEPSSSNGLVEKKAGCESGDYASEFNSHKMANNKLAYDHDCQTDYLTSREQELNSLPNFRRNLTEGCMVDNFVNQNCSTIVRKNSLHMIESNLASVTEGKTMENLSLNESVEETPISQSMKLGGGNRQLNLRELRRKSLSQEEQLNRQSSSFSSNTSLDKSPLHSSRRRNSTISQCSSILSEGTRNQLIFDLSPDLAPDSTITEANSYSPVRDLTECRRPASPEPSAGQPVEMVFDFEAQPASTSMFKERLQFHQERCSPDSSLAKTGDLSKALDNIC